jgi:hypothetical protein
MPSDDRTAHNVAFLSVLDDRVIIIVPYITTPLKKALACRRRQMGTPSRVGCTSQRRNAAIGAMPPDAKTLLTLRADNHPD